MSSALYTWGSVLTAIHTEVEISKTPNLGVFFFLYLALWFVTNISNSRVTTRGSAMHYAQFEYPFAHPAV